MCNDYYFYSFSTIIYTSGQCIINLEEIGNLCPKRKNSSSHVQRAATQILLLLDKAQEIPGIIVIATTNKPDQLDTSLRRHGRLETEVNKTFNSIFSL